MKQPHAITCPKFVSPHAGMCNCGRDEKSEYRLEVVTKTTPEGSIVSEVDGVGREYRNNVTRQIIQAQEEGVKAALKKLGWMSPQDVEQVLCICNNMQSATISKEEFPRMVDSALQNIKSLCEGK